ncbi:hypothetical protein ASG87_15880 [Frateuria sp. Soil773]|uniref:DUF2884 family protein n=1 Tax=Frateuria sp. Soil773 TaxID=1736407 RepID=UPI0006FAB4EA|nr:DUF2884 family protein [Frateuria sp. Soil773]KRE96800.1 hypothetical protein ASG87_15880 [Frateuria sp. Soil773]
MRTVIATVGLLALATSTAHAGPKKAPDLSSHECGFSTPYSVQVGDEGVLLYRHDGAPKEILFHDGTLSIDRKPQPVGEADAQRLRRMEEETRALMPQVAGIARESVGITFDALTTVTRMMTGSERKARKLERHRARALDDIDGSLGKGRWDQQAFDGKFEADIAEAAEEVAHSISRSALWAVFTGRADSLDRRADRMDQEMDRLVDARSEELQRHALALCARVTTLRQLQDALEYRYQGTPLVMLKASEPAATSAEATAKADVAGEAN